MEWALIDYCYYLFFFRTRLKTFLFKQQYWRGKTCNNEKGTLRLENGNVFEACRNRSAIKSIFNRISTTNNNDRIYPILSAPNDCDTSGRVFGIKDWAGYFFSMLSTGPWPGGGQEKLIHKLLSVFLLLRIYVIFRISEEGLINKNRNFKIFWKGSQTHSEGVLASPKSPAVGKKEKGTFFNFRTFPHSIPPRSPENPQPPSTNFFFLGLWVRRLQSPAKKPFNILILAVEPRNDWPIWRTGPRTIGCILGGRHGILHSGIIERPAGDARKVGYFWNESKKLKIKST